MRILHTGVTRTDEVLTMAEVTLVRVCDVWRVPNQDAVELLYQIKAEWFAFTHLGEPLLRGSDIREHLFDVSRMSPLRFE